MHIDLDRLDAFSERLDLDAPDDDPGHDRVGDDESAAAYVMTLDAINFGSGYFPYIRKRPGHSGYHTVAAALRDHVDRAGPPRADWLLRTTAQECASIFDQPMDQRWPAELMGHFAAALRELGSFVERVGEGDFLGVLATAGGEASRLVELMAEMPYYRDVHRYHGLDIPIYKRAQITAFDVATVFDGRGPGRLDGLDQLTMFADNLVPHVLRVEGVLRFGDELIERIDAVEDIAVGSEPEVEIRACGLHAVELMVARMADRGRATTAGRLDGVLWRMGGAKRYKATRRHRTRSVFY